MKKIVLVIVIVAGISFVTASKEAIITPPKKDITAANSSSIPIPLTRDIPHQQVLGSWD